MSAFTKFFSVKSALLLNNLNCRALFNTVNYIFSNMLNNEEAFIPVAPGSKKRKIVPNELYGKFSSKNDFIRCFKDGL